ncbi:MAG: phosphoadenosine phosphosulfate reductase family protein [Bacteroidetes Order II. Incertae sedis bacterium]|jgi:3'-phosphoadenosine 5'-phosphosulfate sulfotransferase (PAPS reductase)/FAD synthetase|nr:phosphoadenosine phosphosulfate reductase family protein [Bacteroidetes Order II. bacterium]
MNKTIRHIVAFSGGKDSSALGIYLKNPEKWRHLLGKTGLVFREPLVNPEYVFCDTGTELAETYDYLKKLEAELGATVTRLQADDFSDSRLDIKTPFDHYLHQYGGMLPSAQVRWCTRMLKLKPYEWFLGDDQAISYVGIRADEDRLGYLSTKPNITTVFPFKEDGIDKDDVYRILEESGVGVPAYYNWRSRSGCYFCFFQRKSEWVGLLEHHPKLFQKALEYEKLESKNESGFTWSERESLEELAKPERIAQIKEDQKKRQERLLKKHRPKKLIQMDDLIGEADRWKSLDALRDMEDDSVGCNMCHL